MQWNYLIITPARDEEAFIEHTIQSMIAQSIVPQEWIIVNDGSTDRTPEIVRKYTDLHRWIRLLELPDRGERKLGSGVVEAFNRGLQSARRVDYEFISKVDADLTLPANYFAFLFRQFTENPRLGIASGCTYVRWGRKLVWERTYKHSSRGMMKVYRRQCFADINGLVAALGWDVIDDYQAQAAGWETRSFKELEVIHHRPMGSSGKGIVAGKLRLGEVQYLLNYYPPFALGSALYRMFERPYLIGGLIMGYGYLRSFFRHQERIAQGELRDFIRQRQKERLQELVTRWW